jgi:hypothetical protein
MAMTIEKYMKELADCGIHLHPGTSEEDLLDSDSSDAPPADAGELIAILGDDISPQVWHFDTECIGGDGSYVRIAKRLASMAGDGLPIEGVTDHVDIDGGVAWLEFSLETIKFHWKVAVQNDWIDMTILYRFAGLLEKRNTGKRFAQLDYGGQDMVLAVIPVSKLEALNRLPGVRFEWLESANL